MSDTSNTRMCKIYAKKWKIWDQMQRSRALYQWLCRKEDVSICSSSRIRSTHVFGEKIGKLVDEKDFFYSIPVEIIILYSWRIWWHIFTAKNKCLSCHSNLVKLMKIRGRTRCPENWQNQKIIIRLHLILA